MSKKKSRAASRKSVLFPQDWHFLIGRLACDEKKPTLWYLVDLVRRDAEAKKVSCPAAPWEAPK